MLKAVVFHLFGLEGADFCLQALISRGELDDLNFVFLSHDC
jgi:hypothetical protein